ncbi:hypothetical protein, partial [Endozoicomonas sp.]|uniref:hypothetical protein n=1 Tax=Endozoicomonas sp. TaxID=1892382 RepID=UPI00383B42DA
MDGMLAGLSPSVFLIFIHIISTSIFVDVLFFPSLKLTGDVGWVERMRAPTQTLSSKKQSAKNGTGNSDCQYLTAIYGGRRDCTISRPLSGESVLKQEGSGSDLRTLAFRP